MKVIRTDLVCAGIILGLSFTPVYGLALLGFLLYVSHWNPWKQSFFDSYVCRLIVNTLLVSAIVMVLAMYGWLFHAPLYASAICGILVILYIGARMLCPKSYDSRMITSYDWLSIAIASTGIIVTIISYYGPNPSTAGSVHLMLNGFDNGAHYSLIETTYTSNGNVYGPYDAIKDEIAKETLTAYPQGWHVANAFIWKGTGLPFFASADRSLAISMYVFTLFVWQFMALFVFVRATLYVLKLKRVVLSRQEPGMLVGFVVAHLLIQLAVYWGSLYFGFASFIGALSYLILLSVLLIALQETDRRERIIMSAAIGIAAAAIGLSWLLPVPVVALMICLSYMPFVSRRMIVAQAKTYWRATLTFGMLVVVCVVPIVAMVVISRLFTTEPEQLNHEGGIFPVSTLLACGLFVMSLVVFMRPSDKPAWLSQSILAILAPQFIFLGLLYGYQVATIGHTAYFFTKSLTVGLALVGIFFVPATVLLLGRVKFGVLRQTNIALLAIVLAGCSLMISGQDVASTRLLLKQGAKTEPGVAAALAEMAMSGELMNRQVIVFTDINSPADVNGNVLSAAIHTKMAQCVGDAMWLITAKASDRLPQDIDNCVRTHNQKVTIITSRETQELIVSMHNPAIATHVAQ